MAGHQTFTELIIQPAVHKILCVEKLFSKGVYRSQLYLGVWEKWVL